MFLSLFNFLSFVMLSILRFVIWRERKWIAMYMRLQRDPWNIPVFGNAYLLVNDHEVMMDALKRFGKFSIKHGGMATLWLGPRHIVVITDANVAEIVLKMCHEKGEILNFSRILFGNSSLFAPVHIWRPRRKVIAPTFSLKNLNRFVEVFHLQSTKMVEQLKGAAGKGTFSIWKYLTSYTMDSVCETTLGVNVDAQRHPDQPFLEAFYQHCEMAAAKIVQPPIVQKVLTFFPVWQTYMKPIYCMWDFVDKIIQNKRNELLQREEMNRFSDNNDIKEEPSQKTFLELFIKSSGGALGFTDMELREETLALLLAGTDTSAVGTAFTCLMLARHTEVQEKVYEEIKEVLGDSERPITPGDLPKFKYLETVIKESLRLYPPAPVIVRQTEKDFQLPSGLTIVKGTSLMINIWAIHRNPKYWGEDVEEFRPDRFVNSAQIHPAAFIAFSYGPRSCIGYQYAMMSMKTAIANLIRHYQFHPATPVKDKNEPFRVKFDFMMKDVENFELKLEPRI